MGQARNRNDSARTGLLGSVVAPIQASLTVRMPSLIRRVFAREGDPVRAGQPLVDLDERELATQVQTSRAGESAAIAQLNRARSGLSAQRIKTAADIEAARAGLTVAETRLQQARLARSSAADEHASDLRAAIEASRKAQIALDRAQETQKSLEELSKVGGVSRSDLEGARAQTRAAQSDADSAKLQIDRVQSGTGGTPYRVAAADKEVELATTSVRQSRDLLKTAQQGGKQAVKVSEMDVAAAEAAVLQARAGLDGARTARAQVRLSSPIAGILTSLAAREGETAQPAAPLATVISLASLRVDALVPARLLSTFRIGQRANVSVDTAPGKVFAALVSDIAHVAEPDGRTFRVKFRVIGSPVLLPGQTARIKVENLR